MSQFFASGGQSIGVSASASVLIEDCIFRTDFLLDGLVGSPCSPRDSQASSPEPQLKSINSSGLSFLYSPTLRSIHDQWKNHSFDQTDLCWQSNVSAFQYAVQVGHSFSFRSKRLLISWLQSPSTEILEPKKINSVTVSTVYILSQILSHYGLSQDIE